MHVCVHEHSAILWVPSSSPTFKIGSLTDLEQVKHSRLVFTHTTDTPPAGTSLSPPPWGWELGLQYEPPSPAFAYGFCRVKSHLHAYKASMSPTESLINYASKSTPVSTKTCIKISEN